MVLELGGSDPFIVLGDANLEKAVEVAVTARFQNTGQSCIAAKRFIVVESAASEFEERFAAAAKDLRRGAPIDPETQLGPMAREDLRDELAGIVDASVAAGATVLTGGKAPDEKGAWYEPTVVSASRRAPTPRCCAKRPSARSPRWSASPTRRRRSPSPTTPSSASARASGPRTWSAPRSSPPTSKRGWSSSTR